MPIVLAAYHIAGVTVYLARVAAADLDALKRLTDTLAEVASVSTQIVLGESFERTPL